MKYNPDYARKQGVEAVNVLIGAICLQWAGWWGVVGWVVMCLICAIYHEIKYR